jgi:ABC-2 type transport system ATP-binding protein
MLSLKNVSKSYKTKEVLKDITLDIAPGSVYCLVGKNGVGKSTVLELLLTIQTPDDGEITWKNMRINSNNREYKKNVGAAGPFSQMMEGITLEEYLWLASSLYGLNRQQYRERSEQLIDFFFRNDKDLAKPIRNFSSGMKRKAMLCAALIHSPEILILDEPFTYLDPASSSRLCDLITGYKLMGKTIIISSHDLLYIDQVATHIGVLNDARLIFNDKYPAFAQGSNFFENNTDLKAAMDYGNENLDVLLHSLTTSGLVHH